MPWKKRQPATLVSVVSTRTQFAPAFGSGGLGLGSIFAIASGGANWMNVVGPTGQVAPEIKRPLTLNEALRAVDEVGPLSVEERDAAKRALRRAWGVE